MSGQFEKRRPPVVCDCNGEGAPSSRGTKCSHGERRRAASGDSYDNVVLINFSDCDCFCPFCFIVFSALNALQYRLHSASHHKNDSIAWPVVCRAKLCAVLNRNATRSASPYINQATTTFQGQYCVIHGSSYCRQGRTYGCASGELPVIHSFDHIAGGPRVEVDEARTYVLSQHICAPFLCPLESIETDPLRRAKSKAPATASASGGDRKCATSGESHCTMRDARPPRREMRGAPNSTKERMSTSACRAPSAT